MLTWEENRVKHLSYSLTYIEDIVYSHIVGENSLEVDHSRYCVLAQEAN